MLEQLVQFPAVLAEFDSLMSIYQISDATVTGQIQGTGSLEAIDVEFDLDGDGTVDVTTTTDSAGNFQLDLAQYLAPGPVTVYSRTANGTWLALSFEYQVI